MVGPALSRARTGRMYHHTRPLVEGKDGVIDLSYDDLNDSTRESVRAATIGRLMHHDADHYVRRAGLKALCEAVAERLAHRGMSVDPADEVVITGGIQETRFAAVRELAAEARIAVTVPWIRDHYQPLATAARATVTGLDTSLARIAPEAKEADVLLVVNPNPAAGRAYEPEVLDRLADWARRLDLTVIADETTAGLLRPGLSHRPFATFPGAEDRTLTLGSFAHIPGLSAWKVAWLAGPSELVGRVRELKQALTICSPAPSQFAALAGIADSERSSGLHMERVHAVVELLDRLALPHLIPQTVAYVVADVSALGGGRPVARTCLRNGVRVLSGNHFGCPDQIRITCTGPEFPEGLSRLERTLKEMRKGRGSGD